MEFTDILCYFPYHKIICESKTFHVKHLSSLQGHNVNDLQVRLGEKNLKSQSEPLKHLDKGIEKVIIHKRFDNLTKEYDIALLSMRSPSIEFQVNICNNQYYNALLTISAPHNPHMSSNLRG